MTHKEILQDLEARLRASGKWHIMLVETPFMDENGRTISDMDLLAMRITTQIHYGLFEVKGGVKRCYDKATKQLRLGSDYIKEHYEPDVLHCFYVNKGEMKRVEVYEKWQN